MRRSLTAAAVQRIKPPAKGQTEHYDLGFPGLALRVSYGGAKSWSYFFRLGGRLRRMTLGTYPALSLAEARDAWREARRSVARGIDPIAAARSPAASTAQNFAAVAELWLQRDQADKKSFDAVRGVVRRELLPAWGHRPITDIRRADILELTDGIVDRGAPTMAKRVHAYVHRLFRWCVGRGILEVNPAADLPRPGPKEKARERVLSDDELVAVWRAAAQLPWAGAATQLLILTGARRSEIGDLRWSEIDGDTIRLPGTRTKSGLPHNIPLSAPARALLEQAPRIEGCEFVFSPTGRGPLNSWGKAKRRIDLDAEIAAWRLHDLRRTVATGLQKLGVGLQVIESALGHVSGSRAGIVGVYQRHSFDAEKRAALEAWGAHVMGLLEGRQPGVVLPLRRQQ